MRQLRHMLRLHGDGVSAREICRRLGVARSTVQENLKRAQAAGLSWPLPGDLTDPALEQLLFARSGVKQGFRRRAEPDWARLACEMKKPAMTLQVLWEEYREIHPEGYGYSRFCDLFRQFEQRLTPTMRQEPVAGDKVFVDYSGRKVPIVDRDTGTVREAELFIGVLGASTYTYAEASWSQALPDWIGAQVRMFRFFGGVPRLIVPDNLKAAVHKASFYDPEINRSYAMMTAHYGVGVLPARARRPRDKAKVEHGVRFAQTCILARLRHQTFFSLAEANAAIALARDRINDHLIRRLGVSRRHLFETIERPALAPLPAADYEFAEWRLARVNLDYHVEFGGFFYSVPHALIREQVEIRATARGIEIFHHGKRVAVHQRRYAGPRHGTDPEHMPSAHRRYAEWSPERFQRWGRSVGPNTETLIIAILAHRPHPEQGFRTCLGVLRLLRSINRVLGDDEQVGGDATAGTAPADIEIDAAFEFGIPLTARHLWEELGIGPAVRGCLAKADLTAPHEAALFAMAANRLDDPGSKRACAERWLADTAWLPEATDVTVDQLYRALDVLAVWAEEIERAVFLRAADLFRLDVDLIFYDTTTAYFEIDAADETEQVWGGRGFAPLRRRGHSKEGRDNQPQVILR